MPVCSALPARLCHCGWKGAVEESGSAHTAAFSIPLPTPKEALFPLAGHVSSHTPTPILHRPILPT